MSTEEKTEIMTNDHLNVLGNMEVKNEDLVAVAVARRERSLEQRLTDAERKFLMLQAKYEKQQKLLEKELIAIVETEFSARVESMKASLLALGLAVKVQLYPTFHFEKKEIAVQIRVEPVRSNQGDRLSLEIQTLPAPENVLSEQKALASLYEEINKTINERIELKKALSDMGSTERKARAALAEASLASSERGRALLAAMTDIPDLLRVTALDTNVIDVTE
jgi:hypothetical protein